MNLKCGNDKNLYGEVMDSPQSKDVIVFVHLSKGSISADCYTSEELYQYYYSNVRSQIRPIGINSLNMVEWSAKRRYSNNTQRRDNRPVLKLPWKGIWVNKTVIDLLRQCWNTILLDGSGYKSPIGTYHAQSGMKGTVEFLYSGRPIHRSSFISGNMRELLSSRLTLADQKLEDISSFCSINIPEKDDVKILTEEQIDERDRIFEELNPGEEPVEIRNLIYSTQIGDIIAPNEEKEVERNLDMLIPEIELLQNDVISIDLTNKQLIELPDLSRFVNLQYLDCSNNEIKRIDNLPETLVSFTCDFNEISTIEELPDRLISLSCSNNKLQELPELPERLQILRCSRNELKALPELPETLRVLKCSYNFITELPELPDFLQTIDIRENRIKNVPDNLMNIPNKDISGNPFMFQILAERRGLADIDIPMPDISDIQNVEDWL